MINENCNLVTQSKWANILGIRNEILGLIFYIFLLIGILASIFLSNFAPEIYFLLFLTTGLGVLYSIFLTSIQIFVIKNYCTYCLASSLLTLLLFLNSIGLLAS